MFFQYFLQNRPFEVDIDFWLDFGANMPPFSLQKSIKIGSKLELGRHRIFDRFLHWFFIDFPSIWDANLELCWPLRLLQDASKTPPRRLPRRSARHFSLQRWFLPIVGRFCSMFDCFWIVFLLIFQRFLVDFGLVLERFCFIIYCSSGASPTAYIFRWWACTGLSCSSRCLSCTQTQSTGYAASRKFVNILEWPVWERKFGISERICDSQLQVTDSDGFSAGFHARKKRASVDVINSRVRSKDSKYIFYRTHFSDTIHNI